MVDNRRRTGIHSANNPKRMVRLNMWITGKTVLVSGGTGSFGHFIVRRLLDLDVAEIRILSRDEKKHYDMRHHYPNEPRIKFITGDIRDERRVRESIRL
jgi:UDP-glucose 4-epimerase